MDTKTNPDFEKRITEWREEIAIGSAQADSGEFVDGEEVFAEIRKRSDERKQTTKRL